MSAVDSITAYADLANAVQTGDDVALALASGAAADSAAAPAAAEPEVDRAKHPSGIVPVLQNVVATVNLGCKLDLKAIALHARNAEYNPKVGAAPLGVRGGGHRAIRAGVGWGVGGVPRPAPALRAARPSADAMPRRLLGVASQLGCPGCCWAVRAAVALGSRAEHLSLPASGYGQL